MVVIAGVEEPPKDELLARLRDERAAWDALVAQAGDLLTEPGLEGDWSLKDVIAHLCAYERFLVTELGGNVRALPPMPPDVAMDIERRNVWMHLHDTDQAATDVLREATDVHAQLLDQIARRSQEALEQPLGVVKKQLTQGPGAGRWCSSTRRGRRGAGWQVWPSRRR